MVVIVVMIVMWTCHVDVVHTRILQAQFDPNTDLSAYFSQFSNRSFFLFIALMVVNTWSCDFVQLLSRFIPKFALSFTRISLHDLPYVKDKMKCLLRISLNKAISLCLQLISWIQTNLCNCPQYLCLFCILVECNPNKHGQGMMFVLPNQLLS